MGASHQLGRHGEALACHFLERAGWTLLERNYRAGRNEVDLVMRLGQIIAFVEVKSRKGVGFGHPLEAITAKKQREIGRVARAWVEARGGLRGLVVRFDAVAVSFDCSGRTVVEHVPDAWRLG